MPRRSTDFLAFEAAFRAQGTPITRRWELTNTRYLLGAAGFLEPLNQQIDPLQKRFKIHTLFNFYQTSQGGPILVQTNSTGPYALIEFTGALPRAKLYSKWEIANGDPVKLKEWMHNLQQQLPRDMRATLDQLTTNDLATIKQLVSPEFDPTQTVLVANELSATTSATSTNQNAGTVEFVSYAPKHFVLRAKTEAASVLLLNDHFDPKWRVLVDSRPATLLRCNYVMRGVQLAAGEHSIEFRFSSGERSLYISLVSILAGFALLAFVILSNRRSHS